MDLSPQFLIGTCGWSYPKDWKNVFYPDFLSQSQYLSYYSQIFPTVEIDSSFYHTPTKKVVQNWVNCTPDNFSFTAKLPQDITHKNKLDLDSIKKNINEYFNNILPMETAGKMLGHLIQLPPSFNFQENFKSLEKFLHFWNSWRESSGKELCGKSFNSTSFRPIVEFRHTSWMVDKTFDLLREYNTAYCAVIEPLLPPRLDITRDDLFYIRFHGFGKNPWWKYLFSNEELDHLAEILQKEFKKPVKRTYVGYFNNHYSGNAVKNAMDFLPKMNLRTQNDINSVNENFEHSSKSLVKKKRTEKENKKNKNPKIQLDKWISQGKKQ